MAEHTWMSRLAASEEGRRLLEQERFIIETTEAICEVMQAKGISRRELANRLGKSPAYVTKMLAGSNNFTLRTLAVVFLALDQPMHISFVPADDDQRCGDNSGAAARLPLRREREAG